MDRSLYEHMLSFYMALSPKEQGGRLGSVLCETLLEAPDDFQLCLIEAD